MPRTLAKATWALENSGEQEGKRGERGRESREGGKVRSNKASVVTVKFKG